MKKLLGIILVVAMLLSLGASAFAAEYKDTEGHWAEEVIDRWSDYGIVMGDEAGFRPDDPIRRGEFATVLNRIMKYAVSTTNTFSDLSAASFYYNDVLKVYAAGVINGMGDGTFGGEAPIVREQAFAMLRRMFNIPADETGLNGFKDANSVSSWARGEVGGMVKAGFVKGSDGYLDPLGNLTRAAAVQVLDNIIKDIHSTAETCTDSTTGTVVVNTSGVVLKDSTINNLYITPGVGSGNVTLNNVTITGTLYVMGGGANSIIITGGSSVGNVVVYKDETGAVRIRVEGGAEVEVVYVEDGSDDVILTGEVGAVVIGEGVNVSAAGATIGTVTVVGDGATLAVDSSSTVKTVTIDASDVTVGGAGKVENVKVESGTGNEVTTPKTEVTNNSESDVSLGGDKTLGSGDTATTDTNTSTGGGVGGGDARPGDTVAHAALDNLIMLSTNLLNYNSSDLDISITTSSIANGTIEISITGAATKTVSEFSGTNIRQALENLFSGTERITGASVSAAPVPTLLNTYYCANDFFIAIVPLEDTELSDFNGSYTVKVYFDYGAYSGYEKTYTVIVTVT